MKKRIVTLYILLLVVIDQIIKLIINAYYLDMRFSIIKPFLEFQPTFNYDYTYINNVFKLGIGIVPHVIMFVVLFTILILLYGFFRSVNNSRLLNVSFILVLSGYICAAISNFIWNGCLDYIYLVPLFVFDLKDVYLNSFGILFAIFYLMNRKTLNRIRFSDLIAYVKKRVVFWRK